LFETEYYLNYIKMACRRKY